MPPKRSKAAASQASSQPIPETPAIRGGRKRRHSDASNASSAVSEATTSQQAAGAKRRRKGRVVPAQSEPAIAEEHEEILTVEAPSVESQVAETQVDDSQVENLMELRVIQQSSQGGEESIEDASQKHVHFIGSQGEDDADRSSASHITPHPRKMGIKRRQSSSPGNGTATRRIKTSRTSLPSSLSQDGGKATTIIRELQFSTLGSVLEERVRRLKELQRTGKAIDSDMLDDLLVLESQEEDVKYPELPKVAAAPSTPSTFSRFRSLLTSSVSKHSSTADLTQSDVNEVKLRAGFDSERRSWESERARFQDAILALSLEAEEAKARLRILTIELEALGYSEGTSTSAILQSIREAFDTARELFETELVGSISDDASPRDVIEALSANVKDFATRLRTQDKELRQKDDVITDLSEQVDALLDRLAQTEIRKMTLELRWKELDEENEQRSRTVEELQEEIDSLNTQREELEAQIEDRKAEIEELRTEKSEFEQTIERLSTSLQQYRDEETRLTALITRMEMEHATTVANMNRERQETVQDLEDRLDAQTAERSAAEERARQSATTIRTLESRIETILVERDSLSETLITVRAERVAEEDAKDNAQADLEEKNAEIEDLTSRIDRLDAELSEYQAQVDDLRKSNETERSQREAAEQDLDERNVEIDEVNVKLREAGRQANELRQKLFEVQQTNKTVVEKLELKMASRDEQFQADMAAEVERREEADELAQERATSIVTLETRLKDVEQRMAGLIVEQDDRVAELEATVLERDQDIKGLEADLRAAEERYDEDTEKLGKQIEEFEKRMLRLQETIGAHETSIRNLEQEALETSTEHSAKLEERNLMIVQLNATIRSFQTEMEALQSHRANLERRVESEAEQMLVLQNTKADEIEALQATIRDKQAKILVVQEKAQLADLRWQEVVEARDEEILTLRANQSSSEETVESLSTANSQIQSKFEAYIRYAEGVIGKLKDAAENARATVHDEGIALVQEGEGLLEEIASMGGLVSFAATTVTKKSVASSSATTTAKKAARTTAAAGGRKKRFVDSGIGVESLEPQLDSV